MLPDCVLVYSDVGCFSLWNVRVGLSAGIYFKGVQVVLVWKYSE
eukprot:COSAG01_NODE_20886_length_929_cov_7.018072_1_plen_43_part_10